jgi:nitrate reductase gamma subunit
VSTNAHRPTSSVPPWPSGHINVPLMDVTLDRNGLMAGLIFAGALTVLVFIGSQGLRGFDGALAGYCFSALFAVFGIVYRYAVWLQRPATRVYWTRGWRLFWEPGRRFHNVALFFKLTWEKLLEQGFIRRRSRRRWLAHQLIFWGCTLAILVTFPLTFGWIRFESVLSNPANYVAVLFGVRLEFAPFAVRGGVGWTVFHLLDISAVLCLAGVAMSVARRLRDEAEIVTQRVDNDFMPLVLLFAVSVTGLMLTVSNMFMAGKFYYWITTTHAVTVMLWLLFLPFGKFFHIFQRVANLGVWFYKAAGVDTDQAACARCGQVFTSILHRDDLKAILPELEFDYALAPRPTPSQTAEKNQSARDTDNWQNLCPSCRRKLVTLNQFRVVGKEFM